MPLIKTQISKECTVEQKEQLAKTLSKSCANVLGKPEQYVASIVEDSLTASFAGEISEFVYVELKSIGALNSQSNRDLSAAICSDIEALLGIPGTKVYIEMTDVAASFFGWNGTTFG